MSDDNREPNWVHNLRGILSGVAFLPEMHEAVLKAFNEFYASAKATEQELQRLKEPAPSEKEPG